MTLKTLHINNPSKGLLDLVKKLEADKDAKIKAVLADKSKYLSHSK